MEIKTAHDLAKSLPEVVKESACKCCLLSEGMKNCKSCAFYEYLQAQIKTNVILTK